MEVSSATKHRTVKKLHRKSVLKDAAAVYGSRSASGVILIETEQTGTPVIKATNPDRDVPFQYP
jgi:TonB-dependent SusC/RagA subfamily outer membrane receptor